MRISVDNDGRETEHFSLAQAGGCSSGEFLNIGDDQFVKDGDTKAIDFPICINQEGISGRFTPGARYATSIFLRDIRGEGLLCLAFSRAARRLTIGRMSPFPQLGSEPYRHSGPACR